MEISLERGIGELKKDCYVHHYILDIVITAYLRIRYCPEFKYQNIDGDCRWFYLAGEESIQPGMESVCVPPDNHCYESSGKDATTKTLIRTLIINSCIC